MRGDNGPGADGDGTFGTCRALRRVQQDNPGGVLNVPHRQYDRIGICRGKPAMILPIQTPHVNDSGVSASETMTDGHRSPTPRKELVRNGPNARER